MVYYLGNFFISIYECTSNITPTPCAVEEEIVTVLFRLKKKCEECLNLEVITKRMLTSLINSNNCFEVSNKEQENNTNDLSE